MERDSAPLRKASAFAVVIRPDDKILCTREKSKERGARDIIGVPGGKWDPAKDRAGWEDVLSREFQEEVGVPLPVPTRSGYLEWGNDTYQIRFKVLYIDEKTADTIPTGARNDPSEAVLSVFWADALERQSRGGMRPHVRAAIQVISDVSPISDDISRPPKTARPAFTLEDAIGGLTLAAPKPGPDSVGRAT